MSDREWFDMFLIGALAITAWHAYKWWKCIQIQSIIQSKLMADINSLCDEVQRLRGEG